MVSILGQARAQPVDLLAVGELVDGATERIRHGVAGPSAPRRPPAPRCRQRRRRYAPPSAHRRLLARLPQRPATVAVRVSISVSNRNRPAVRGGRGGAGRVGGGRDQFGFARLASEFAILSAAACARRDRGPAASRSCESSATCSVSTAWRRTRVVDLGDRRRALRDRGLGVGQPRDRRGPFRRWRVRWG